MVKSFKDWILEGAILNISKVKHVATYNIGEGESLKIYGYKNHHYVYHYVAGKSDPRLAKTYTNWSLEDVEKDIGMKQ